MGSVAERLHGKRKENERITYSVFYDKGNFYTGSDFGIYFLTRPIQKEMEKELRKQCAIPLIIIGSFTMLWMTLTMKI